MSNSDPQPTTTIGKKLIIAGVILLVIAAPIGVVAETFLSSFYTTQSPIHVQTDNGCEIITQKNYNLQSGNPFTPTSYNLSTQNNGWLNISSPGTCTVTVDEINGTWTNVSGLEVASANVTLDPSDKTSVLVGGTLDSIQFKQNNPTDSGTDFTYTATSTGAIVRVGNVTGGTQYGAVDQDTNEALDAAVASGTTVTFTDLESGTHDVRVQELGNLTIREESEPHNKITSATATVRFFEEAGGDDATIVERTASNGVIDLTGLPVDESFVATVEATDYTQRAVFIPDLSQQETIFLLNTTKHTEINNTFVVQDRSGNFPPGETDLLIQKAINHSEFPSDRSGLKWTIITGDSLGADQQLVTELNDSDRYRIKVQNDDDDTRVLGEYNAKTAGTIVLEIGQVNVDPTGNDLAYNWTANQSVVAGNQTIQFEYNDSLGETTSITIQIYELGNQSNQIEDSTFTGTFNTLTFSKSLLHSQNNTTWVLEWSGLRDGESIGGKRVLGRTNNVQLGDMPPWMKEAVSLGALFIVGGLVTGVRAEVGAFVTSMLAGVMWYFELLPTEITGGIVVLGMAVSGMLIMRDRGF